MLETILAIAGKPGLYKLVSRGNRSLIVESIDDKHQRMPAFSTDRVISLADIAMYTDEEEVPLADVLTSLKEKENGSTCSLDIKKASKDQLFDFFAEVLPNFDRDRVFPSDVKKLIQWYNILIQNGLDDFSKLKPTEGDNIDDRKEEYSVPTFKCIAPHDYSCGAIRIYVQADMYIRARRCDYSSKLSCLFE